MTVFFPSTKYYIKCPRHAHTSGGGGGGELYTLSAVTHKNISGFRVFSSGAPHGRGN